MRINYIVKLRNKETKHVQVDMDLTEEEILNDPDIIRRAINSVIPDIAVIYYHPAHDLNGKRECVGCGFCCLREQCPTSVEWFGKVKRCPHLRWIGYRYICDIFYNYKMRPEHDTGCNCNMNKWRDDVKER